MNTEKDREEETGIFTKVSCPFCNDFGFDMLGLEDHLKKYYCPIFGIVEDLYQDYRENKKESK